LSSIGTGKESKKSPPRTFDLTETAFAPVISPFINMIRRRYCTPDRRWKDIPYAFGSPAQKLDIYLPREGDGPFPVVIWIHGGGWFAGTRLGFQLVHQLSVLRRGYALVSMDHRLSGEAIFPAQIHDVKAAIRWIRANAKQYSFDPTKIAVWGASAGAHLAALAGTSAGVEELEDLTMGNPDESSRVQAVIDWYGPMDLISMDEQLEQFGFSGWHNVPDSPESQLVGGMVTEQKEIVEKLNPITYISKETPPFLIEHGFKDRIVPMQQSVLLYQKLVSVIGAEKVMLRLLNGGHGNIQLCPGFLVVGPFTCRSNMNVILDFLDRHLKHA